MFYKAGYNTVYHDGIELAGYLAFLGIIALFPFLVFVVALAGFIGEGHAGAQFVQNLLEQMPPHITAALKPRVDEIISGPPQGLLTVSIVGAIWTSSSAVEGYRTVLNRAYHVGTPPAYIWRRLQSVVQILLLSVLVVAAMVILVLLPILWHKLAGLLGDADQFLLVLQIGNQLTLISLAVLFCTICLSYYVLPNIKQNWHSVVPGAALVTFLLVGAAWTLTYYLSQFEQVNLIYGSLGGIIAVLLFFYIGNIIFIYGAELNYLIKKALGEKIEQKQATEDVVNDS